jgi:hypothetical protein|tara:strand:- start:75 stop:842 length:768 start_codon:yes stop_codon:yes gene_type:complete
MNIKNLTEDLVFEKIEKYFSQDRNFDFKILDIWFPDEARTRSYIGGLETSLGQGLWENLAVLLASNNGFEVLDKKEFNDSVPKISSNLNSLIAEFTTRAQDDDIPMSAFLEELKAFINSNNIVSSSNQRIKSGTGVDVWLKKDETEYMFDIKTVKPNRGSFNTFFQQLIYWNAHRVLQDNDINLRTAIVFPYNPFETPYWENYSCNPLVKSEDALADNEFWKLLTDNENAVEEIFEGFHSLNNNKEFIRLKNTYF